ncbi:beta strand repeat-containing protein, partial [Rugamonas apoptosis]
TWNSSFSAVEGGNNVIVRATDVAGNTHDAAAFAFTLDTTIATPTIALTTDSGTSNTDKVTNNAALTFSAPESGAARVIKVDGNTVGSYNAGNLVDGTHTVTVTDTDVAGNVSAAGSITFTLDKTIANPTLALSNDTGISKTDRITNDATLAFSTLENGANRIITVDGVVKNYDPTQLADGAHTVSVVDTDLAGNVSKTGSLSFTLDKTITTPTVSLTTDSGTSNTDKVTNNAALTFSTPESGVARVIKVDGNTVGSYNAGNLVDGTHTVTVTDTDVAGNVSAAGSITFTLDKTIANPTLALSNDTGISKTDKITNDATLTFSALENGANRIITVDGVVKNYDPTQLADGTHTVSVVDTDLAGNVSKTGSLSFTLDKTITTPTVSLTTDSGTSNTDKVTNTAALTFSAPESGAARVIKVDGNTVGSYNAGNLVDGTHTVTVTDTDVAGNVSAAGSITFTLDKTIANPTLALFNDTGISKTDKITNDATLTFSALENGGSRVVTVDGVVKNYDPTQLADGAHTVSVVDTDLAGNVSKTGSLSFTLDKTITTPTVSLTTDSGTSNTDKVTNNAALTFSVPESGAARVIKVDGNTVGSYNAGNLVDGTHTVTVTDTDVAGNVSAAGSITFTLDKTIANPTLALSNDTGISKTDKITNDATLTFSALENGGSRVVTVDGVVKNYDPTQLADGAHTVSVVDTDLAGNVSKTGSLSFTLDKTITTPTVSLTTDSGTSNTDKVTNNAALTFSVPESGAARVIKVDGNTVGSYNAGNLVDGTHTVTVTDTDVAGNVSAAGSITFTLDKTIANPTLALSNDTGISKTDKITNDATLTFSALENGGSRVVTVDGVVKNYDPTQLADGAHTVSVVDTDLAGNVSKTGSISFTLDRTIADPAFSVAKLNSNSTITLSGMGDSGTTVTVTDLASNAASTGMTNSSGTWTIITAQGIGVRSFSLSATDAAGNNASPNVDAIIGTSGADLINNIAGHNDMLFGGQGVDKFVFAANFGKDVINDFLATTVNHDIVQFSSAVFSDTTAVLAHAVDVGSNVVISDSLGDTLTLIGVHRADLSAADFIIG